MKRRLTAVAALVTLTGCSAQELEAWLDWHAQDPQAAIAHANTPEVQADLAGAAGVPVPAASARGDVWAQIAECESGGDWSHPPVTNRTGTYSGGLMIGHRWWPAYGGARYASAPYLASRAEQIAVAENIAGDVGLDRGWQCWP